MGRVSVLASGVILLIQVAGHAESSVTFACLMTEAEMQTVSFAIVNPNRLDAEATFTLYGLVGEVVQTSRSTIPGGGQLIRRAADLFPQAQGGGWVQATSDVSGLRGFWMMGDFVSVGDTAEAEASAAELILPLITISSDIVIINTASKDTAVRIKLFSVSGQQVDDAVVRVLPPKGAFRASANSLFSPRDWASVTHAKISSGAPVSAAAQVGDFRVAPSLSIGNAVPVSTGATNLVFPHVVQGPLNSSLFITTLGITNISSSAQVMNLTFHPADGSPAQTVQRTFPGNGAIRASARTIFGFGDEFRFGWVQVSAPRGAVGFSSNADVERGGSTMALAMSRPQTDFIFGYLAASDIWSTGLTFVNAGESIASVDIFALAASGSLIGGADNIPTARFQLPPDGKISRLVNEWIAPVTSSGSDGGFIFVRSSEPIFGFGLLFTRDDHIFSVVPEFDLPRAAYDPPSPGLIQ
jgi:hypothetical protein